MMERQSQSEALQLPTPLQLQKLSTVALAAANSVNKLKYFDACLEPVYVWVEEYDSSNGDDRRYERFSGRREQRVLRGVDYRTQQENVAMHFDSWSLRYRQLQHQHLFGGTWVGELKTYMFEWDSEGATVSQCYSKEIPSLDADEIMRVEALDEYIDNDEVLEPTWSASAIVTAREVALLTASIRQRRAFDAAQRQTPMSRWRIAREKRLQEIEGRQRAFEIAAERENNRRTEGEGAA